MGARKFHGITRADYGTTSSPSTQINKIEAKASAIEFPDQEGNAEDAYGNRYAGVQYVDVKIRALDLTAYAAIYAAWLADTKQFFKLYLDNGETWTTTVGALLKACKEVAIKGKADGDRADGFDLAFQLPRSAFNVVTA